MEPAQKRARFADAKSMLMPDDHAVLLDSKGPLSDKARFGRIVNDCAENFRRTTLEPVSQVLTGFVSRDPARIIGEYAQDIPWPLQPGYLGATHAIELWHQRQMAALEAGRAQRNEPPENIGRMTADDVAVVNALAAIKASALDGRPSAPREAVSGLTARLAPDGIPKVLAPWVHVLQNAPAQPSPGSVELLCGSALTALAAWQPQTEFEKQTRHNMANAFEQIRQAALGAYAGRPQAIATAVHEALPVFRMLNRARWIEVHHGSTVQDAKFRASLAHVLDSLDMRWRIAGCAEVMEIASCRMTIEGELQLVAEGLIRSADAAPKAAPAQVRQLRVAAAALNVTLGSREPFAPLFQRLEVALRDTSAGAVAQMLAAFRNAVLIATVPA